MATGSSCVEYFERSLKAFSSLNKLLEIKQGEADGSRFVLILDKLV